MRVFDKYVVGAVIRSADDRILMGRKAPGSTGVYPHDWILPGGVVEDAQTKGDALIGEVFSETGIDLTDYPVDFIDDHGAM